MTRNIILIILDTVRKDFFDSYASRLQSREDVSFSQCRTASSCSVPSHGSIMTGRLPSEHGIHSAAVDYSGLGDENTFLGDIPDHRTLGVSTNTFAGQAFGFDAMFDDFVDVSWTRRFPRGLDVREFVTHSESSGLSFYTEFMKTALRHESPMSTLGNASIAQLDMVFSKLPVPKVLDDGGSAALKAARRQIQEGGEPFFLFMNLMEAHTPHQPMLGLDGSLYDVPNRWSSTENISQWAINRNGTAGFEADIENFRELYGANIDYLDRKVTAFLDWLDKTTTDETTVVITADHGENLGYPEDDGLFGHNSSLSEGLLHVPLSIVNPPEGYADRETGYFSHLELGRLLTGLANGDTPDVFSNRIPAERILTTNLPDVDDEEQTYWNRMLRCAYEGDTKFVWDSLGESQEFELNKDRPCWQRERESEGRSPPTWAMDLFETEINEYKSKIGGSGYRDVDEATQSRLEELGYL